ncbi:hypothetical protein [Brachybacterium sp. YJGR34]|uniref:hypothetical protein n=1 Tax=Brachybacterium sp. YJGR34 TaxID=2059911 RepID=UPI000E0C08F7|nr:hypothetical protein [Brachybacterium sp. YJGR34]
MQPRIGPGPVVACRGGALANCPHSTHRTSTQELHPWRAGARTAVQILVPALILFVVAQPIIDEERGAHLPDALRAWYAAAAFLTAFEVALTRIMALPSAQRLLGAIGLGTGAADGDDA